MKEIGALNERYYIRAVERALILLKSFLDDEVELSAGEISKRVELDPSTTFRMLVTLQAHGFVRHDPATGKYRLGVVCLELGSQFLKNNDIRRSALDAMKTLRDQFGETVHLGILDGDEIVYLEKVPGLHAIGLMSSRVGGRAPAHATAIGKILLGNLSTHDLIAFYGRRKLAQCTHSTITSRKDLERELAQVRQDGYATDNQEFEVGVKCVAVPIYDHKGMAAGLSISAPIQRMDEHIKSQGLIEQLKRAVVRISSEIGWGRGVDQVSEQGDNKSAAQLSKLKPPKGRSVARPGRKDRMDPKAD